ncbi:MAG: hypothetical protein IKO10_06555 [Lachnospiraceae bacterium]|nr:hypothetical protein [Lachnospiraceae bacterium]
MMKKNIILLAFAVNILFAGCVDHGSYDNKPDDEISKYIKDMVGDEFYYHDHRSTSNDVSAYDFEIMNIEAKSIGNFVDACNNAILNESTKISFSVCVHNPGGMATVFLVRNYSDTKIYDGIYYLWIVDQTGIYDPVCDPELYSDVDGIKELHVDKAIQDIAENKGIDWYSYWPELETVVIEY